MTILGPTSDGKTFLTTKVIRLGDNRYLRIIYKPIVKSHVTKPVVEES